jgi:AraC family transcriptional regulator of adaptative response/methylated-DNA-[protein]-cysteine methyltransferase
MDTPDFVLGAVSMAQNVSRRRVYHPRWGLPEGVVSCQSESAGPISGTKVSNFRVSIHISILYYYKADMTDYERITDAILFIQGQFRNQPTLDEVAAHVHLSPYHFQRVFKRWAGVSPKKFLQYISIQYAKNMLKKNKSLLDVTHETGLSGTSRLHDLFVTIEGMTPGEYKSGGQQLAISFSFAESPFGHVIVASTPKGICYLAFIDSEIKGIQSLRSMFPNASFTRKVDLLQQDALQVFTDDWSNLASIRLHLTGTRFQLKIWETLLSIPFGKLSTYSAIGETLGLPKASRAVGSAVGKNPVAYLIPCHRVIQSSGVLGGYHWGSIRKTAIIGWEAARTFGESQDSAS